MAANDKWGEGFVRWREFVGLAITIIVTGAGLFAYLQTVQTERWAEGREAHRVEVEEIKSRITRQELRTNSALERIETKLDKVLDRKQP